MGNKMSCWELSPLSLILSTVIRHVALCLPLLTEGRLLIKVDSSICLQVSIFRGQFDAMSI